MALAPDPVPCSTVILRISAKGLKNRDLLSISDPMCVLSRMDGRLQGRPFWTEIGRTEALKNDSSPEWQKQFELQYFFEEKQTMAFEIYDVDSKSKNLEDHDFLGRFECDLAEIVSMGCITKPLTGSKGNCGTISIFSEEKEEGRREAVIFRINAEKLDRKDFFGKTDPFLKVYRILDSGSRVMVHRTKFVKQTLNPTFTPFELTLHSLCGGDKTKNIVIECWDDDDDQDAKSCVAMMFSSTNSNDFVGGCEVSVNDLLGGGRLEKELINERKQAKKGKKYKNSGTLIIQAEFITVPTFLDYISGGTQLDFSVAIDFTASNGKVGNPDSLHYMLSGVPNQYEVAIRAVLEVCQFYNNSKVFDAYGFGAAIPPNKRMVPIFSLKNPQDIDFRDVEGSVVGTEGVLTAYRNSLHKVQLYGPTNFAPIIEKAAAQASIKCTVPGARYQILLIITDGAICDMQKTISAIVRVSTLPLSIIIVGVGNADFENMDQLDGDDVKLSYQGRICERDIVQFVPMRKFLGTTYGQIPDAVMAHLAKEVLAEVPLQLTTYMRSHGIQPRPPDNPFPRDPPAASTDPNYAPQQGSPYQQSSAYPPQNPGYPLPGQQFGSNPAYPPQQPGAVPPYPPPQADVGNPTNPGYPPPSTNPGYPQQYPSNPGYPPQQQATNPEYNASAPPVSPNDIGFKGL